MTERDFKIALVVDEIAHRSEARNLLAGLEAAHPNICIEVIALETDLKLPYRLISLPNSIFKTLPLAKTMSDILKLRALSFVFAFEQRLISKRRQYKWLKNNTSLKVLSPTESDQSFDAVIWLSNQNHKTAAPHIKGDRLSLSFGASPDLFHGALHNQDSAAFYINILENNGNQTRPIITGSIMAANRWLLTHTNLTLKAHAFLIKLIGERADKGHWIFRDGTKILDMETKAYIPSIGDIAAYAFKSFLKHPVQKFWDKTIRRQAPLWSISVMRGDGLDQNLNTATRIQNPKDRFLADPYVITVDGQSYCFVEDFFFDAKKGKISAFKLSGLNISASNPSLTLAPEATPRVVLEEDFHLSFPFIFQQNGETYMIPETSAAKQIRLYKATQFPYSWKLEKILMDHVDAADTMVFEHNKLWYMLTNICSANRSDHQSELHLFSAADLMSDMWVPSAQNPIIFNSKKARNAGFFKRDQNIYRVNQVQARAQYGYAFEINQIIEITPNQYSETCIKRVEPETKSGMARTHHYHFNGDYTVFDHSYIEPR